MGWMTADEEDETYEWLRSRQRCKAKSETDREMEQIGYHKMTEHSLKAIALQNGGYEAPELNDTLYLHFKGFRKIENLEPYTHLTALWLGSNGLEKAEGLGHLSQLRCLYLQQNLISEIGDGFKGLNNLSMVDISHNKLESFSGFECLPLLETLIANHNALRDAKSALAPLQSCPALKILDIGNNSIGKITETGENVVDVLSLTLPKLLSLTAAGNPFYQDAQNLRKRILIALPLLNFLDRPVFEEERVAITAWAEGGRGAELKARKAFAEAKHQKQRNKMKEFRSWQEVQRYKATKAKEARWGYPIPLTPNETRIVEERNKAAANERESERKFLSQVGLVKLGDTSSKRMPLPSTTENSGGVQREFGGRKVAESLCPDESLCHSSSKDDDSGAEKDKSISDIGETPSLRNVITNDDMTSDVSYNTTTCGGYNNRHDQNKETLDIGDYQVATLPSSQVTREENENSSGSSLFVVEDHQLIGYDNSGTQNDLSCDEENSERPPPQVEPPNEKNNGKLFSSDSAVAHPQPPLTEEATLINFSQLFQLQYHPFLSSQYITRFIAYEWARSPPPPHKHTALVQPLDINAVGVINRTGKLAMNISKTMVVVEEDGKLNISSSSNDYTPAVQHVEGSTTLSLPQPLHDADCNQYSKTLVNPVHDGFIPNVEQLGTEVASTYISRYLSCPVGLPSLASQDSASEGDDADEIG